MTTSTRARASGPDLTPVVGANLRRIRVRRGLSLERLAAESGVSRAMLSQVELGQSTPTINVLWRISSALEVPFSALLADAAARAGALLRGADAKTLSNHDGTFRSRALFPFEGRRQVEFYELRVAAGGEEQAQPHALGTYENLAVSSGDLVIEVSEARYELAAGDSLHFRADVPHVYRNEGAAEALAFLVMTYAEPVG